MYTFLSFFTYVWNQQALLTCHWDRWERLRYKACDLPRSRLQDWELPEVRPKKADKETLKLASTALISYTPMSMDEQRRILTEAQNALQMLATNRCFILSLGFVMDLPCGWSGGSSVYDEDPLKWTLKQWSHHGELVHVGVAKDPGNWVYYVMFLCFQGCSGR